MYDELDKVIHILIEEITNRRISFGQVPIEDILTVLNGLDIGEEIVNHISLQVENRHEALNSDEKMLVLLKMMQYVLRLNKAYIDMKTECYIANKSEKFRLASSKAYNNRYKNEVEAKCFCGKGVIYTVITGGYDELKEPLYKDDNFDYICFTDSAELKSDFWDVKILEEDEELDNLMLSRKPKLLPHLYLKDYDYSIYVDGKLRIIGDLREYICLYEKQKPMLCFPHFARDCVYEEAKECITLKKDLPEKITKQMDSYRQCGLPQHYGLIDAACIVRRHNDEAVIKVMDSWWNEMKRWNCRRDQLCFGYACFINQFSYDVSSMYIYRNPYLQKERKNELPI